MICESTLTFLTALRTAAAHGALGLAVSTHLPTGQPVALVFASEALENNEVDLVPLGVLARSEGSPHHVTPDGRLSDVAKADFGRLLKDLKGKKYAWFHEDQQRRVHVLFGPRAGLKPGTTASVILPEGDPYRLFTSPVADAPPAVPVTYH